MHEFDIAEYAYKNGYEAGLKDGKEKWFSVEEKLPDDNYLVIVIHKSSFGRIIYSFGFYELGMWYTQFLTRIDNVIAWRKFELYEEKENENNK